MYRIWASRLNFKVKDDQNIKIDTFFKLRPNISSSTKQATEEVEVTLDMCEETSLNELDSGDFNLICPHCDVYLACNLDYFNQHTDFCLKL